MSRAGCRAGGCRRGGDITCADGSCDIAAGLITEAEAAAARALDAVRSRHNRTRGAVLAQAASVGIACPGAYARWDMGTADRLALRRAPLFHFATRLAELIAVAEREGIHRGQIADELRRSAAVADGQSELLEEMGRCSTK